MTILKPRRHIIARRFPKTGRRPVVKAAPQAEGPRAAPKAESEKLAKLFIGRLAIDKEPPK